MLPLIIAGAQLGLQLIGNRKAKKQAAAAAQAEASRIAIEEDRARDDLMLQAQAARDQQALAGDRLALADRAEAQAESESAQAQGPDVTLAIGDNPMQKSKRRSSFFKQAASGVKL